MKPFHFAIVAGALSAMTAGAIAQTATTPAETPTKAEQQNERHGKGKRMERLDTNKDGVITQDEFAAAKNLKDADTNNDGVLSPEEITAMVQKREVERQAARLTKRLDIDGDGKVTLAEIEQHRAKQFAVMDRNNDGKLEAKELRRGDRGDRHERHGDHKRGDGHGKHWKKHGKGHGSPDGNSDEPDRT